MKCARSRTANRTLPAVAIALAAALTWQSVWAASVTLNLKDADIGALIGTVAEVTGTNFIVDPRVKGKVTVVSSKPMDSDEVYQVFLSILKVHGFAAVPSGSVVKIVPDVNAKAEGVPTVNDKAPGRGDEVVTRVIEVNNVSAAQLVPILRPLVPQQGHMAAYPGTNVLIISDRAENIERLVEIVRRMDQQSDSEIEVMPLQHASAAEIVRIITALERPQGGQPQAADGGGGASVIADERTNSVLIGGDKSARLRLRMLISHLDTPLERGGNTHVIYLKYSKAKDLVEVLTGVSSSIAEEQKGGAQAAGGGGGKAAGALTIQADESSNALVINAPPDVFRSLESVVRQLDIRRAQVHVEAVIAEINTDRSKELGIQWRGTDDLDGAGVIGGTNFPGVGSSINAVAANPLNAGAGLSVGYFEGTISIPGVTGEVLNLGALVRALASDSDSNILSTPNLVTLDNQEAEIVVAQNVPFLTGSYSSTGAAEGAANPFQTIQREDVGLTLKVKPQINEGDAIRLEIEQEISSVGTKPAEAADIVTNKRSIKTTVMVDDKQMIVLGGLLDDNLTENVQKVPVLGDLPVLGHLFKARSTTKTKRNLMVFMQPSILRDAAYTTQISAGKYNFMRGLQTKVRENGVNLLPSSEAPLLPEYPYAGQFIDDQSLIPSTEPNAPATTAPLGSDILPTTP